MGPTNQTSTLFLGVGLLIMLLCLLPTGSAIRCWDCNSEYDKRCGDPFRPYELGLTDCAMQLHRQYFDNYTEPANETNVCRKIIQKVEGTLRVIRTCAYLPEDYPDRTCYRRVGTFDVQVEYCQCQGDGCNAASDLPVSWIITVISTLPTVISSLYLPFKQR